MNNKSLFISPCCFFTAAAGVGAAVDVIVDYVTDATDVVVSANVAVVCTAVAAAVATVVGVFGVTSFTFVVGTAVLLL